MATNNYIIRFRTLRGSGYDLVLHIGGGSGSDIELKGAAQPFVTSEDADEDVFKPVRTQTGYIRIVDDGKAADGVTAFDWHDLIPASDTERPVTLTKTVGGVSTTLWQGFMQTQTFDGPLYSGPTEREFPVQCMLSALDSIMVDTSIVVDNVQYHVCNFYMLIYQAFSKVSSVMTIDNFKIQGGEEAAEWLKSNFDWQNLLNSNSDGLTPRYSYLKALEDMCRFWGFTLRTAGTSVYMTQYGASDVVRKQTITLSNVLNLAKRTSASYNLDNTYYSNASLYDFANTEQQETALMGYKKAIVKAECNNVTVGVDYTQQEVSDQLGSDWRWSGGEDPRIGKFQTTPKPGFISNLLIGTSDNDGSFSREQIFASADDTEPTECNVIGIPTEGDGSKIFATLTTRRQHRFGPGSIRMTGDIWRGTDKVGLGEVRDWIIMQIGIGPSVNSADTYWFNIDQYVYRTKKNLNAGWKKGTVKTIHVFPNSGKLSVGTQDTVIEGHAPDSSHAFESIPIGGGINDGGYIEGGKAYLEGFVFVRFLGSKYTNLNDWGFEAPFEIANFKLEYSRDTAYIPATLETAPQGRTVTTRRQTSYEYENSTSGKNGGEWSADCIFASDLNMEYGLGLLMGSSGTWLNTVAYNGVQKRPEVHLATAVASFWNQKRTMAHYETQNLLADIIRPDQTVSGGYIAAIGYDWRDAIVKLDIIQ